MAESTLSLTLADLKTEVCQFLGFAAYASCTSGEKAVVDKLIKIGLRTFYRPATPHKWSFLKPRVELVAWATTTGTVTGAPSYASPVSTVDVTAAAFHASMIGGSFVFDTSGTGYPIVTVATTTQITVTGDASGEAADDTFTITSDGTVRLPDAFGGIIGPLFFEQSAGYYHPIEIVSASQIAQRRQQSMTTGRPQFATITPVTFDPAIGQRFDLLVWPAPNTDYTLVFRYNVRPDVIPADTSYPYGGMDHAETIREACLAAAEETMNDEPGVHVARYTERLVASIAFDRDATTPETLGMMTDGRSLTRRERVTYALYEGTLYD